MSRIMSDTIALQNTISSSLATAIKDPVTVLGLLGLLFSLQSKLTWVTVLVFPACLVPVIIYSRKVRRSSAAIQDSYSELSTVMHESFTGNRIIKAYNLEEKVVDQFRRVARNFVGHYMRIVRSQEIPGPLIEFMGSLGVAALFVYYAFQPDPDAKKFIQFAATIFLMYRPIKNLVRLHSQLEQAQAASRRVFDLLEMESTVREPANPVALRAAGAPIQFDDVHFSYGDKLVLQGIQLTLQPGQMTALVGASGSGKTTLTNLLLRFYDPQKGAVRIGGTDIRDVTTRELRNQIAVVTQETILFNDTVRRNIALGRPGAKDGEIEQAARHAFAHDFIIEKPHGYEAEIGEKGVLLSGGQRQRLAIARAVLKNAPILVLDEATSSLDMESERAVQSALEELMAGRTTICIAHRLSTVQKADLIVVLDQGRIVETGRHAELIRRGGVHGRAAENPGRPVQVLRRYRPHDSRLARHPRALAGLRVACAGAGGSRSDLATRPVAEPGLGRAPQTRPRPAPEHPAPRSRAEARTLRPIGGLWRQRSRCPFEPALWRAGPARPGSSRRISRTTVLLHATRGTGTLRVA